MCLAKAAFTTGLLVLSLGATAVQIQGPDAQARPGPAANAAAPIERGGTITKMDAQKRQMTVDGVPYSLLATTKIHPTGPKGSAAKPELRPGNQIRFNTLRSRTGTTDEVTELWVMGHDRRADKR